MKTSEKSWTERTQPRVTLVAWSILLLVSCGGGGPKEPAILTVTPLSGPPGTVLSIAGLELAPDEGFEVWLGEEPAPATLNDDGTLSAAIPLFLGPDNWPQLPSEPQIVEVRRSRQVLGRSASGVSATELPKAPGSTQEVQAAFAEITDAYARLFSLIPPQIDAQTPIREGVIAMLQGLVSDGENSLQAVLDGSAPLLDGAGADTELVDALLASSGALDYFRAYADALQGASAQAEGALSSQSLSLYCDGDGPDFDLACQMQIYVVLDDYSRAFVKPTVETYANTVGLVSGLLAMGTVAVPGAAIIGAILSVADFVMEKVAPALFPAKLSQFELKMLDPDIDVGETTDSQIFVTAVNAPPQITYLDIFEQVKTLTGLKNIEFNDKFYEVLKATAEFTLDLYLKIVKTYEASHPGTHSWVTAGDIRIPAMSWGPVEVKSERLVTLFSYDEEVVQSLEQELEWKGLKLGKATVRVMPRGPGEKSKVLRDHALCLGCVYSGGAFGSEMPDSKVEVVVGEVDLTATPQQGKAPLNTTFTWTGLKPQDEPLTCILDVGDGSTFYTIQDCAVTTSQTHSYPYTSVLESAAHSFEATLKVVGTEKTATTEVTVDWTFTASPAEGKAPLDTTYTWNIPYPADGGAVRCTLDPGDNSRTYSFENCLATTTASHTYESKGSYVATLTISNAITQDTKTAPVSVSEESSCAGVMDAKVWQGSISYSHGRDVADEDTHIIYQNDVNVTALLAEKSRGAGHAGFFSGELGGNISISREEHDHGGDHRIISTFSGSGTPMPFESSTIEGSRMFFNVYADCSYSFYTLGSVWGSGTSYGEPAEGALYFNPLNGKFNGASRSISGSYAFPVYADSDIVHQPDAPDTWFIEQGNVVGILGKGNLGTVTVTWSFTAVE